MEVSDQSEMALQSGHVIKYNNYSTVHRAISVYIAPRRLILHRLRLVQYQSSRCNINWHCTRYSAIMSHIVQWRHDVINSWLAETILMKYIYIILHQDDEYCTRLKKGGKTTRIALHQILHRPYHDCWRGNHKCQHNAHWAKRWHH